MTSTVEDVAARIAEHFPELKGRSISVSEVEPFRDKTNVPRLPLAVTALVNCSIQQTANGSGTVNLRDDILVQFIFEPTKYTMENGAESPFFAFYDYEAIRDRMLVVFKNYRTPRNGGLSFVSMDVESDEHAVYLAFRFTTVFRWCPPEEYMQDGQVELLGIGMNLRMGRGRCENPTDCELCSDPEQDPCYAARLANPNGAEANALEEQQGG